MERFAQWVIRHRVLVIGTVAILTLAGGFSIVQYTRIESDISKYLPADDPVVSAGPRSLWSGSRPTTCSPLRT